MTGNNSKTENCF